MGLLEECLSIAVQAPSGSNAQNWQFVFVSDPLLKEQLGEIYARAWREYVQSPQSIFKRHEDTNDAELRISQERSADSANYLSDNIKNVPVLMIPCYKSRTEGLRLIGQATRFASIYPAVWSFMLAARDRGLGTCLTTMHLMYEEEVAKLLNIPFEEFMQCGLVPIAYSRGESFNKAYRLPVQTVMHMNTW